MRLTRLLSFLAIGLSLILGDIANAQTTVTIGMGSSSSSTRGPFQRADTNSSTVFSRFVQIYTAAELASAGIVSGSAITQVNWELASSNTIIGSGDATLKVYVKNSSATMAAADTWVNQIAGSSLLVDHVYNTTNNFPGANGWMPFVFSAPFIYTGGAIEIAVDWDCSQVSTPAFNGNGAIKFRWESTAPDTLVVKRTASSSPSTNITDLKDERANIQFVYSSSACAPPTALNASNITTTSADLNWAAAMGATAYNWKVVAAGAGSGGTAVDEGSTASTMAMASNLMELTPYDLYVQTDCGMDSSGFAGPFGFLTLPDSQTTAQIGFGSSSSSTRGPFQRSDTNSSTIFSRFVHVYTAAELATAGITNGLTITHLNWELASSNVVIGDGNATMKVYVKNSSATAAMAGDWSTQIAGSDLLVDHEYNTTNNFPGANGWMPFAFAAPFVYTGGSIEIAVDWDCSQVSTPAFSGDGSLKWRWESTAPDFLVVKKTSSSGPSSNISDLKDERANIQFVYATPVCEEPTALNATNIGQSSADLSWSGDSSAMSFNWRVVPAGDSVNATAVDSGSTSMMMVSTTALTAATSYDLYVEADCGTIGTSGYVGPFTFTTTCADTPATMITAMVTSVSCNGERNGAIDITVTAGVPSFSFLWNTADTTEDLSDLAAGLYTVTITDGDGCPYFDSVMVDEPDALVLSATSVPDTANAGLGSASVMVTGGTPPYAYVWDGMAGSADSSGLAAGTYMVTITDANDCIDSVDVMVDNAVSISHLDYITDLTIMPNPTNGMTLLDLSLSQNAEVGISVYTIRGELIAGLAQKNVSQLRHQIDLSSQADGVYVVRVTINNQAVMKKILLHK
ncbi:MAG: T9SS type A sorting domain-containing protein [Bacteroidota bacterium]